MRTGTERDRDMEINRESWRQEREADRDRREKEKGIREGEMTTVTQRVGETWRKWAAEIVGRKERPTPQQMRWASGARIASPPKPRTRSFFPG